MKPIVFSTLATIGVLLATDASATNHPRPCTDFRDKYCKPFYPAEACDKLYQDAIAHNGVWKARTYDRRMNQMIEQTTNCVP